MGVDRAKRGGEYARPGRHRRHDTAAPARPDRRERRRKKEAAVAPLGQRRTGSTWERTLAPAAARRRAAHRKETAAPRRVVVDTGRCYGDRAGLGRPGRVRIA